MKKYIALISIAMLSGGFATLTGKTNLSIQLVTKYNATTDVGYSPKGNVDPLSATVSITTQTGKIYSKRVGSPVRCSHRVL